MKEPRNHMAIAMLRGNEILNFDSNIDKKSRDLVNGNVILILLRRNSELVRNILVIINDKRKFTKSRLEEAWKLL